MVYVDEKKLNALSTKGTDELDAKRLAYDDVLCEGGHLIAAQALQGVDAGTTLRLRNGKVSVTDGPFAETHEQLGGFILIDARELRSFAGCRRRK